MCIRVTKGLLGLLTLVLPLVEFGAQGATSTFTATHSPSTPDWNDTFSLQAFNPALGSLQSVYILATETLSVEGSVYNAGASPESFSVTANSGFTLTLPGTLGTLMPYAIGGWQVYNLAPGASSPYGPFSSFDSLSATYTSAVGLAAFTGTGTLNLAGATTAEWQISGGNGNIVPSFDKLCGATVQVQYTFAPVPEPSSFALLALGGAAMLLRRRRQA